MFNSLHRMLLKATLAASLLGLLLTGVLASPLGTAEATAEVSAPGVFAVSGLTFGEPGQSIPSRVRAEIGGVVCGTADILAISDGYGWFSINVVSEAVKPGCGYPGALVEMQVLDGQIGPARTVILIGWQATQTRLDLDVTPQRGTWAGQLPHGPGDTILRWNGVSNTPIAEALALLPREAVAVYFWDAREQRTRVYIPGAPAISQTYLVVQTDDIVVVRVQ